MGLSAARAILPRLAALLLAVAFIAAGPGHAQSLPYDLDALGPSPPSAMPAMQGATAAPALSLPYQIDGLVQEAAPFDATVDEGALTILGVGINGRDLDDMTTMAVRGGAALVPADDLRRWRLRSDGRGAIDLEGQRFVPLASVAGLAFRIDQVRQMLVIDAPAGAFETTALSIETERPAVSPAAGTAFLNYDLSVEHAGSRTSASAFLEMGGSNDVGLVTNTMLVSGGSDAKHVVRLDSFAIRDDPSGLTRLVLGDSLTRGSSWSPQTRFAGVRFGTDFSLQPGFLSFPTPIFNGQAALPSNVEVFVNNVLRYQTQVDQGPFALNQLPLLAGAGQVSLQVKDALGVDRTVLADYYVSTRLLRPGLADYSLELGAQRQRYGFRSFDYGDPFAAGTYRYGVAGWLTAESRIELSEDLQMIGGGLATTLGNLGEFGFSVAGSRGPDGSGGLYRLFASRISPFWSLSASYQGSTRDYGQLGQVDREDRPRTIFQLTGGLNLGRWGNINVSRSYIRRVDDARTRVSTFTYGRRVGRAGNLSLFYISSDSTGTPDATTAGLSFSLSIGERTSVFAQADGDGRRIELQKALPTDRGWGYRLRADDGDHSQQEADISYRGRAVELTGQVLRAEGATGVRLLGSGGFLLAGGSVFPTRRLDSGFAIVDVGGQPGVRVFQDNREVARTNDRGVAIVTQLRPYEANRIAVASDDLNLDTTIRNDTLAIVPRFQGGVFARFNVSAGRAGTLVIETPDGRPLEPGVAVRVEGAAEELFSGFGGEVFLDDLKPGLAVTAMRADGPCRLVVPQVPGDETLPRVGPVRCEEGK